MSNKPAHNRVNVLGKKFGKLLVQKYIYTKSKKAYWQCICECNKIINVSGDHLRNGSTQSCGCSRLCKRYTVLNTKQSEILDGLIISDGSIGYHINKNKIHRHNASFNQTSINQKYIEYIKNTLPFLWRTYTKRGKICNIFNRTVTSQNSYGLASKTDNFLTEQYKRWYKNNKKIIPNDLQITPLMLKHWFYGDGCTSYVNDKQRPHLFNTRISLTLCTNGFTYQECQFLQQQLKNTTGIYFYIRSTKIINQYMLHISSFDAIKSFFDYIGPCDVAGFEYKWKVPLLRKVI